MSYENAMRQAGAEIIAFENFGDYQGTWWAKVRHNGVVGWVSGSYGSCSGCDAYEAEMDDLSHYADGDVYHSAYAEAFPVAGCAKCAEGVEKIKQFGESYLSGIIAQDEAEKQASEHIEWDSEAEEVLKFLRANAVEVVH